MGGTSPVTVVSRALSPSTATMGLTSYYAYGLPTFTVVVIALYLLFTGKRSLRFRLVTGFAKTRRCRFGGSFQCRPVP
jgi:hypothetical protein